MPAQAGWGAGFHGCVRRGRHSWRRLWRTVVLGPPGPVWPMEAMGGGSAQVHWDPHGQRRPWQGWGLRPGTRAARGGFGGGGQK